MEKKKVVIIGGGFAGTTVAKSLEKEFDVTLIDTKEYFEFTPGVLRTIVEPGHVRKIEVKHDHYLHKARIVIGCVIDVLDKEVVLKSGEKIRFDYLVIASGSSYNKPIKEQEEVIASSRANHLRQSYEKLCKAKRIVICGGGLVGVELAAEIGTRYKDKKIYLMHSGKDLMRRNNEKSRRYAQKFLESLGIKIVFGERIKNYENKKVFTESGKKIGADMVFLTVGIRPNFKFMKNHFSKCLDDKGFVKVNKYLQLEGKKNIFVAGDVSNVKEEKLAQNAEKQAEIVIHNIRSFENEKKLCMYESEKRVMVISLGKWNGILEYKNFVFTGIFPAILKSMIEMREVMLKKKVM